jgi:serine/threonine protein phosphatase PrpC
VGVGVIAAGDCRALLIQRGATWRALSVDHKAGLDSEIKRVEAAGGMVSQVMGTYRVQGVLAVTRYTHIHREIETSWFGV